MRRFVWLTEIPGPYRNHSFEVMHRILPEYGIELCVWFLAWRDSRRPWSYQPSDLQFPWRKFPGTHGFVRGIPMFFHPTLLATLRVHAPDAIMIGGYGSPTHALAAFAAPPSTLRVLGCESNVLSEVRHGLTRIVKRAVVRQYDAFLVPQHRSLDLLAAFDSASATKPYILFPNIIDRTIYVDAVAQERSRASVVRAQSAVESNARLLLCVARLSDEKGLTEFFKALRGRSGLRVVVAGDGPLRSELHQMIARDRLPVELVGALPPVRLVPLYAAADAFVLPSIRDPSPLSVVEALAAGLPLIISSRVGNIDDVLVEDENGWSFDPLSAASITDAIDRVASASVSELKRWGSASLARYHAVFDSDRCVHRLGASLAKLIDNHYTQYDAKGIRHGTDRSHS